MTAKRKKPNKPTQAQRELTAAWEKIQSKWVTQPKFARDAKISRKASKTANTDRSSGKDIKSFTTPGGSTALAPAKVYTGDAIIGLATMHKSNIVPIFNTDAAKDVASMRR